MTRGAACGLLLMICGCARFGFDASGSGPDAVPGSSPFGRGSWQLGTPQLEEELSSAEWDGEAFLLPDSRTIYLGSTRQGGLGNQDIYRATRADPGSPFGTPVNVEDLNSPSHDALSVTQDGRTAFLTTDRPGSTGRIDIWLGTRESTDTPWSSALFQLDTILSTAHNDFDPFPSPDGLRVYYAPRDFPTGGLGEQDIVVAARPAADAPFEAAQMLLTVSSAHSESDPTLSPDERVIVFTSNRPGGEGRTDLWYAVRPTTDEPFGEPRLMPVVNSSFDDGEAFISADGTELYFSSDRPGGLGTDDIYRAVILQGP